MTTLLTVAVPAFMDQTGVERIVEKFAGHSDVEILVSEDIPMGSTGSMHLAKIPNMQHWQNCPALGAVPNWNYLLSKATGRYVWVVHHDEVPTFQSGLDAFANFLQTSDADMLISNLSQSGETRLKKLIRNDNFRQFLLKHPRTILLHNYIGSPSNVIIKKELLEKFDENLTWYVDLEWFFRLVSRSNKIELSKFEIISLPNERSITKSIESNITRISLEELRHIADKHSLRLVVRWIWSAKIFLRDVYANWKKND